MFSDFKFYKSNLSGTWSFFKCQSPENSLNVWEFAVTSNLFKGLK